MPQNLKTLENNSIEIEIVNAKQKENFAWKTIKGRHVNIGTQAEGRISGADFNRIDHKWVTIPGRGPIAIKGKGKVFEPLDQRQIPALKSATGEEKEKILAIRELMVNWNGKSHDELLNKAVSAGMSSSEFYSINDSKGQDCILERKNGKLHSIWVGPGREHISNYLTTSDRKVIDAAILEGSKESDITMHISIRHKMLNKLGFSEKDAAEIKNYTFEWSSSTSKIGACKMVVLNNVMNGKEKTFGMSPKQKQEFENHQKLNDPFPDGKYLKLAAAYVGYNRGVTEKKYGKEFEVFRGVYGSQGKEIKEIAGEEKHFSVNSLSSFTKSQGIAKSFIRSEANGIVLSCKIKAEDIWESNITLVGKFNDSEKEVILGAKDLKASGRIIDANLY